MKINLGYLFSEAKFWRMLTGKCCFNTVVRTGKSIVCVADKYNDLSTVSNMISFLKLKVEKVGAFDSGYCLNVIW